MPDFLPGDRLNISASEWNRMRRMLRMFEQTNGNGILGGGPVKAANPGPLWVQNTTAADIDAFNVIGLDEPLFDPATVEGEQFNGVRMKGVTPDAADHANAFAVIQEPATKDGGFARAIASGHTWALVNVTSTSHTHADLDDGETVLTSGTSGPFIILKHNGSTGEQLCPGIIDRGGSEVGGYGRVSCGDGTTYAQGDYLPMTLLAGTNTQVVTFNVSDKALQLDVAGIWSWHFNATIWAPSSSGGNIGLGVEVKTDIKALGEATRINIQDGSKTTGECIASSGVFEGAANEQVRLQIVAFLDFGETTGNISVFDAHLSVGRLSG